MVKSPKAFCKILNVSATEISFRKQNLMALLCSTNSDIVKIEKITFRRFWKHKRSYVTNDDIDMKFGTGVSNSRTNIKIKEFARIDFRTCETCVYTKYSQ